MTSEKIGVVVIGRNEGDRLIRCLESVRQNGRTLVYVDSGSTDGSIAAAVGLGARIVELDTSDAFTAARARNAGYDALKAAAPDVAFVQFVDGDCELNHDWIDSATAFLVNHANVAVACGRRRERYPEASIYNRLCDDEWATPVGEALACGGDALIRVRAFEDASGFNPTLIAGEEPELCIRLRQHGWKIWRLDAEMTLHDAAMTRFREWWKRSVRAGFAFALVSGLHARSPFGIWKREAIRPIVWAGLLPLLIVAGTLLYPAAGLAIAIYPLQVARIALRRNPAEIHSWVYAFFMTLARFPELQGIIRYRLLRLRGGTGSLIEYK